MVILYMRIRDYLKITRFFIIFKIYHTESNVFFFKIKKKIFDEKNSVARVQHLHRYPISFGESKFKRGAKSESYKNRIECESFWKCTIPSLVTKLKSLPNKVRSSFEVLECISFFLNAISNYPTFLIFLIFRIKYFQ